MSEEPSFASPEEELRYLERRVVEKRKEMSEHHHREVVSEAIKEHTAGVLPRTPPPVSSRAPVSDDLERDVAYLVQVAFQEGVVKATQRARDTHNPHLIDAFHDALVDKFLADLKERGVIDGHG